MGNPLCEICENDEQWHKDNDAKHKFASPGEGLETRAPDLPAEPEARPQSSGDPILRLALIKKGVLTENDLDEASAWFHLAAETGKALVVTAAQGYSFEEVGE